jgi:two-component system cell cycle response regulator
MSHNYSMTSTSTPSPVGAAAQESRPRILVTDDSRVIRQAIRKILSTDFEIIQAENGAVAWELLSRGEDIQALITDIEMPEVDGYELICRLRGSEDTNLRDLPVIVITGTDDESTRHRAFACGATDFIIKPIDSIQLQARVKAYVRYDQATKELTERTAVLEEQAITDPVTGLRSRRYFVERGEQDLAFATRRGKDLTVVRIEIDDFKKIYRAHGDEICDRLLMWLAKLLVANARVEDTVARIAGAEFAILANAAGIDTASVVCDRVHNAVIAKPFIHGQATIPVTLSMGVASVGQDRLDSTEALLKLAHQRLCHARSEGGNRFCTATAGQSQQVVEEVLVPAIEAEQVAADNADPIETLPVEELEDLIRRDAGPAAEAAKRNRRHDVIEEAKPTEVKRGRSNAALNVQDLAPMARKADDVKSELLSIDRALHIIADGRGDTLTPYLNELVQRLKPLIDFCRDAQDNPEEK